MIEALDNMREYGALTAVIVSILAIFVSGLFFGITYYTMDVVQTGLESVECDITENAVVSSCQELFEMSFYPILELREILVWFSYFFIFALVLGLLVLGYQSGKSPVLLGLLIIFIIIITYLGIEVSNIYRTLLETDVLRNMLSPFVVYNKIMLYFPWFTFFVGVLSVMLSTVNFQKTRINKISDELNY